MDLEKAYNKIDNLCCVNHMAVTLSNMSIDKGVIPDKIDFFNGYNETHDDSFCKDTKDMVEALETIKELVDLQEELGCPLESMISVFKAMQQDHIYCDIGNGMYKLHNFRLDYADLADDVYFTRSEYHYVLDDDCCIFVKDYKKTWWLKEDRSE